MTPELRALLEQAAAAISAALDLPAFDGTWKKPEAGPEQTARVSLESTEGRKNES